MQEELKMPKFVKMTAALVFGAMVIEAHAEPSALEVCSEISSMAGSLVSARFAGVPMAKTMEVMTRNSDNPMLRQMVLDAYDIPDYSTQEYQERAKREHENREFAKCMRAFQD